LQTTSTSLLIIQQDWVSRIRRNDLNSLLDNGTIDDDFCSQFTEQLIDDRRAFEELSFRELPHTVEEPWWLADGDAEV